MAREEAARYGAVGRVPWTFVQTVRGTIVTLAPWLLFIFGAQLLATQSAATGQRRLSTAEDILGGVVAFIYTGVVEVIFVIAPAYYAYSHRAPGVSRREGLAALGLRRTAPGPAILAVIVGFLAIVGANFLYSILVQAFNLPVQTNSNVLLQRAKYAPVTSLALVAGAVLIAPICEEIFFRGYLFGGLLRRWSFWPSMLLSSFLFALAHGDIGSFVVLFVVGMVLAVVRWRIGSLWAGIAIHVANNATAAIAIILVLTG
jgi:uncharacterized protein